MTKIRKLQSAGELDEKDIAQKRTAKQINGSKNSKMRA